MKAPKNKHKILRHVTSAFAEDPVRILRVARFAARFADFSVAPETMRLMQRMVAAGETDHLVPERSWQEISRGLMEQRPSRMLAVLRECDALAHVLPEVDALFGVAQPSDHHPEIDTGEHLLLPGYDATHPTLEIFSYHSLRDTLPPEVNRPGLAHLEVRRLQCLQSWSVFVR